MPPHKIQARTPDRNSRLPSSISRLPAAGLAARILIVDPDRQLGVTLSFMLATRRYEEVRSVRSAGRAKAIAEQFLPDIVFLDFDLPDGGGIPLARLLTRDANRRRPTIIALAAHSDSAGNDQARTAGFERRLMKPISHEELDAMLRTIKFAA